MNRHLGVIDGGMNLRMKARKELGGEWRPGSVRIDTSGRGLVAKEMNNACYRRRKVLEAWDHSHWFYPESLFPFLWGGSSSAKL